MNLEPFVSFENFEKKVLIDKTHECVTADGNIVFPDLERGAGIYPLYNKSVKTTFSKMWLGDGIWDEENSHPKLNLMLRRLYVTYVIDPATNEKIEDAIYVAPGKRAVVFTDDKIVVVRVSSNSSSMSINTKDTGYELVHPEKKEETFHGLTKKDFRLIAEELIRPVCGTISLSKGETIETGLIGCTLYHRSYTTHEFLQVNESGNLICSLPLQATESFNWIGAYRLLTSKWTD